jgi:hypothetical protein
VLLLVALFPDAISAGAATLPRITGSVCAAPECAAPHTVRSVTFGSDRTGASVDNGKPATGTLKIVISGLPKATNASVTVREPNGHLLGLKASKTITGAPAGSWVITARSVDVKEKAATYYPNVTTTHVTLKSKAVGTVTVKYLSAVSNKTLVASKGAVQSASTTNGTETVTVSDPGQTVNPGDTLTAGASSATPDGLLLHVATVTRSDGVDSVTGTPASLTDIGPQANINVVTGPLGTPGSNTQAEGANVDSVSHAGESSLSDPLSCSGSTSGSVGGTVSFTPSINFALAWGGLLKPSTFTASASMSGTEQATLRAEIDAGASCTFDQSVPPEPIVLAIIDVQVGPAPIIITPELDFELEADGTVDGRIAASATQTLRATAGLSWNGSSLSPIASLSNSFSSQAPTVTLDGTLHAQVGPKLTFTLDGVAGPYITADAFATLTASLASTPWWSLKGGFEAGGGIAFDIFGEGFSKGDPSILSKSWTIAQSTTAAPLTVSTQNLGAATAGDTYSQTLAAEGGTAPYSWALSSGNLPAGLELSSSGTIAGTPTAIGTSTFAVRVTDSAGHVSLGTLSLTVNRGVLTIATPSLPGTSPGQPYSTTMAASGGTSPYQWAIASGSLPSGLTLDAATGTISGTIPADAAAGSTSFEVQVTDSANSVTAQTFSITIGQFAATELPAPPNASTSDPSVQVSSVSCVAEDSCIAVGSYLDEYGSQDALIESQSPSGWSAAEAPGGVDGGLESVTCIAVGSCVAVGGDLVEIETGLTWAPVLLSSTSLPYLLNFSSVSCPASGSCVAVGSAYTSSGYYPVGAIATESDGSWSVQVAPAPADGSSYPGTPLESVACPAVNECTAVGYAPGVDGGYATEGWIVTDSSGTWTGIAAPQTYSNYGADGSLASVSCSSTDNCLAVGDQDVGGLCGCTGLADTESAGVWTASDPVPPDANYQRLDYLTATSCTTAGCVGIGNYSEMYNVYDLGDEPWFINSAGAGVGLLFPPGGFAGGTANAVMSISCPTLTSCGAVGSYATPEGAQDLGAFLSEDNGVWTPNTAPTPSDASTTNPYPIFSSISCSDIQTCTAIGSFATANGTRESFAVSEIPSS